MVSSKKCNKTKDKYGESKDNLKIRYKKCPRRSYYRFLTSIYILVFHLVGMIKCIHKRSDMCNFCNVPWTLLTPIFAIQSSPHSFRETLPDGNLSPPLYIHGNHMFAYVTDESGYTVTNDDFTGFKVYATLNETSGNLIATNLIVGIDDPNNATNSGLLRGRHELPTDKVRSSWEECGKFCIDVETWKIRFPHLYIDTSQTSKGTKDYGTELDDDQKQPDRNLFSTNWKKGLRPTNSDRNTKNISSLKRKTKVSKDRSINPKDYSSGKLFNLVILIRFSDHISRPLPSKEEIDILMNQSGGHPSLAPSGSVSDFFLENSYGRFDVISTVVDWITLPLPEYYYADKSSGATEKYESALRYALKVLDKNDRFSFSHFDQDGDGLVDAIMFLHSGYGAEWGKKDCNGREKADRIWAHKWSIEPRWKSSEGYEVSRYHTSSALWGTCGSDIARIGTISHEIGHVLGLPDLYSNGAGVGSYGLMGNSWGFDGTQYYPPALSAWSKVKLGMVEPKVITDSGLYYLKSSTIFPEVYKLSLGYPEDEYLLIENRQKNGFDSKMPQGGIVIWHVDDKDDCSNQPGYPNQLNWPHNGHHYNVAMIQADGNFDLELGHNRGDATDVWHENSPLNYLGPSLNFKYGPFPNTDSYQSGIIKRTGHVLDEFSKSGTTMSFRVTLDKLDTTASKNDESTSEDQNVQHVHVPTGLPTMKPTLASQVSKMELETPISGETGSFGNFFDVINTSPFMITITTLSIHTRSKDKKIDVEVFTKKGSHIGFENDALSWTQVSNTSIEGLGYLKLTPIPEEHFENVDMNSGETWAFYVTLRTPDLRYTKKSSDEFSKSLVLNTDLEVLIGSGVGRHLFGPIYPSRAWNGKIFYEKHDHGKSKNLPKESFKLATTFRQNNGSFGSMFNVVALYSLSITSVDIHVRVTSEVKVQIYTKIGTHIGHSVDQSSWIKIVDTVVVGAGVGLPTTIPAGAFPQTEILRGETRAFYITLTTADLRYLNGQINFSDQHLKITESVGVGGYPFGAIFSPRIWNGSLRYFLKNPQEKSVGSSQDTTKEIVTTFENGNGSYGIQFDILPLKDIYVVALDIHTRSTAIIQVEIYTRHGTHKDHEKNAEDWKLICDIEIQGLGLFKRTPIPRGSFRPMKVLANERQAFYLTLKTPDIRYSNSGSNKVVTASNDDLQIFNGSGIGGYPFGRVYPSRLFNGVLHYYETTNEGSEELMTLLEGGNGSYGNIFNVKASRKIEIYSLSLHAATTDVLKTEVWTAPSHFDQEKNRDNSTKWVKIVDTVLFGKGRNFPTDIPISKFKPVVIEANQIQSFYVTFDEPKMRYTNGNIITSDDNIEVYGGFGIGHYPLESAILYPNRVWNGIIFYR